MQMEVDGGSDLAVTRRVGLGWKAYYTLSTILCGERYSLNLKGCIYKLCARPVMAYSSEAWVVRSLEEDILRRAERQMNRKMCGVKLVD